MGRTLAGADHSRGKLDELFVLLSRPDLIPDYTYKGFPCPKGHQLRHQHHHWCVQCASDIVQNKCGMDINTVDVSHASFYSQFFQLVDIPSSHQQCWLCPPAFLQYKDKDYPKVTALTYRTGHLGVSQTVTLARFIYSYFWGDVGSLTIKRTCSNPQCWNPLHMRSIFNIQDPPEIVSPLQLDYSPVINLNQVLSKESDKIGLELVSDALNALLAM
jgi:hypothetical protein